MSSISIEKSQHFTTKFIKSDQRFFPDESPAQINDGDLTSVPSYTQFLTEKSKKDGKLQASLKASSVKKGPNTPSISTDEFTHPVYLRAQDIDRLFKNGYIHFTRDKMLYLEPEQKKYLNL